MAKPLLEVDGGSAPPTGDEPRPRNGGGPGEEAPSPPFVQAGVVEPPEEWSRETLKTIVALPFMAAHIVARRQGPPDAWMPDDDELDVMAGPLLGMANRYAMLRALARFGDPVAFTAAVGTYTVAESRRMTRWRLQYAEEIDEGMEEEMIPEGLHVAAERPGARPAREPVEAQVRPWRPPVVSEEA